MKAVILFIVFFVIAFLVLSSKFGMTSANQQYVPSIVNPIKKVTGQTSHDRRVLFNEYADTIKYSPETGQRISFVSQKIMDNIKNYTIGEVKNTMTASAATASGEIVGSSEPVIGIEEIATLSAII